LEAADSPLTTLDDDIDSQPRNSPAPTTVPILKIYTQFNPAIPTNTKVEYTQRKDKDARHRFTEKERKLASKAEEPSSLADLSQKVSILVKFAFFY
jgi:hypothetical protein